MYSAGTIFREKPFLGFAKTFCRKGNERSLKTTKPKMKASYEDCYDVLKIRLLHKLIAIEESAEGLQTGFSHHSTDVKVCIVGYTEPYLN